MACLWIYLIFLISPAICKFHFGRSLQEVVDQVWTDEDFNEFYTDTTRFGWCEKQSHVGHCFTDLKKFLAHAGRSLDFFRAKAATTRVVLATMGGLESKELDPAHAYAKAAVNRLQTLFVNFRAILIRAALRNSLEELTTSVTFMRYCHTFIRIREVYQYSKDCRGHWSLRESSEVLVNLNLWSVNKVWILYLYYERCLVEKATENAILTCKRVQNVALKQVQIRLEAMKSVLPNTHNRFHDGHAHNEFQNANVSTFQNDFHDEAVATSHNDFQDADTRHNDFHDDSISTSQNNFQDADLPQNEFHDASVTVTDNDFKDANITNNQTGHNNFQNVTLVMNATTPSTSTTPSGNETTTLLNPTIVIMIKVPGRLPPAPVPSKPSNSSAPDPSRPSNSSAIGHKNQTVILRSPTTVSETVSPTQTPLPPSTVVTTRCTTKPPPASVTPPVHHRIVSHSQQAPLLRNSSNSTNLTTHTHPLENTTKQPAPRPVHSSSYPKLTMPPVHHSFHSSPALRPSVSTTTERNNSHSGYKGPTSSSTTPSVKTTTSTASTGKNTNSPFGYRVTHATASTSVTRATASTSVTRTTASTSVNISKPVKPLTVIIESEESDNGTRWKPELVESEPELTTVVKPFQNQGYVEETVTSDSTKRAPESPNNNVIYNFNYLHHNAHKAPVRYLSHKHSKKPPEPTPTTHRRPGHWGNKNINVVLKTPGRFDSRHVQSDYPSRVIAVLPADSQNQNKTTNHIHIQHVVIGPWVICVLMAVVFCGFIAFLMHSCKPRSKSKKGTKKPGAPFEQPGPPTYPPYTGQTTSPESQYQYKSTPTPAPAPPVTQSYATTGPSSPQPPQPPKSPTPLSYATTPQFTPATQQSTQATVHFTSATPESTSATQQSNADTPLASKPVTPVPLSQGPPTPVSSNVPTPWPSSETNVESSANLEEKIANLNRNSCPVNDRSDLQSESSQTMLERKASSQDSMTSYSDTDTQSQKGGQDGWSHALERWFNPNITAAEAQDLLIYRGRDGSFLVRSCQSPNDSHNYVLCVKKGTQVITFKIQVSGESYELCGEKFPTLKQLIDYYKDRPEELEELVGVPVELKHPMNYVPLPDDRCYHPNINREGTEELLMQQGMDGCYLLRPCQTEPGHYYLSFKRNNRVLHKKILNMGDYYAIDQDHFKNLISLVRRYSELKISVNCVDPSPASYSPRSPKKFKEFNLKDQKLDTSFTAISISQKVRELTKLFFNSGKSGFMVEFEQLKYYSEPSHSTAIGKSQKNSMKNRFANIVPYDEQRIVLRKDNGDDYINASKIVIPPSIFDGKTYIATQAPMPHTVEDFWLMVWQEECKLIVMCCDVVEQGKLKCEKYWPDERDEQTVVISPAMQISVVNEGVTEKQDFTVRQFSVSCITESHCSTRTIWHYQYLAWLHYTVPKYPGSINRFLREINARYQSIGTSSPLLVHCSDGAGRTGAVIIMDVVIGQINKHGKECYIDILALVRALRQQRPLMVLTPEQYRFIYLAVQNYIGWYLQQIQHLKKPKFRPLPLDDVDPFDAEVRPVPPSYYKKLSQGSISATESQTSQDSASPQSISPRDEKAKHPLTPFAHSGIEILTPFATSTPSSLTGSPAATDKRPHNLQASVAVDQRSSPVSKPAQPITPIQQDPKRRSYSSETPKLEPSSPLKTEQDPTQPELDESSPYSEMSTIYEETSSLEPSTTPSRSLTSSIVSPDKQSQSTEMPPIPEQSSSIDQSSQEGSTKQDESQSEQDASTEQSPGKD